MTATETPVAGLHHVTAISGAAQGNYDFYVKALGLRFIKKTVNFDDPSAYHFYFGDAVGSAGAIMTFFPWEGARPGRVGAGQVAITQFAAPEGSLGFWRERLPEYGARVVVEEELFGEKRLVATDPEGMIFAIVEVSGDDRAPWTGGGVAPAQAIRGFRGVTLAIREEGLTRRILEQAFGYAQTASTPLQDGALTRLRAARGAADVVDLHVDAGMAMGVEGAGVVHHVAFSVKDRAEQDAVRRAILALGQPVTPPIDRDYFFAIYARTPSGVLFEVATEEPGFAVDEPVEALGTALKLPKQHEPRRAEIEAALPPLEP